MSKLFQDAITESGTVECLGQTFANDAARREHFLKLLAEKLKQPEFRKIEGFPKGTDEDILALSDPPYYTACPNPFIGKFVEETGQPYDPNTSYKKEPFAADVSEGKNDPIYNAHSYHTKVPHKAIMRYILHYTQPGDLILDGFCGTGMTGVAAYLCGNSTEIESLGYHVKKDGTIIDQDDSVVSKLGPRSTLLNDLAPAATFIACNYNAPLNLEGFKSELEQILKEVEEELGWMFSTRHTEDGREGVINYVVWSDVDVCPECEGEFSFWDEALDKSAGAVSEFVKCPHCTAMLSKRALIRKMEAIYDPWLKTIVSQAKQIPVVIDYSVGRKRFQKAPDEPDLEMLKRVERMEVPYSIPTSELPPGDNTTQPKQSHGLTHIHHFYTRRTLHVLDAFVSRAMLSSFRSPLMYVFTSAHQYTNRLCRLHVGNFFNRKGGTVDKPLTATLYMPSLSVETNAISRIRLRGRVDDALVVKDNRAMISTQSLDSLNNVPANCVDYIFIDPPFGANIMYSEVNFLWEGWLKVFTNNDREAVHNEAQDKDIEHYGMLMRSCFSECYRLLKPGRWMTVEFSNTRASIWNLIQTAIQESGFVVGNVSSIDKQKGSFKAVTTPTAVKQDLVISAYKPNGGLEERFSLAGGTPDSVWDFVRTHLKYLASVKMKGGALEFIAERDPRIVFDRMVAWFVRHNVPIPVSSTEFQEGLRQRFVERDGMIFLPEQAADYEKRRALAAQAPQMELFVMDERSAIDWLSDFLKKRPSTYQELHPEFITQLGAGWKKHETRPELAALLESNFIQYDGAGEVPSQIHSYLSTNHKDLRGLSKGNPFLVAKAKDRWYVPDPNKAQDLEKKREKALLKEFETYQAATGRRAEGVPFGGTARRFQGRMDGQGLQGHHLIAQKIPEEALQEDEKLLLWYDQALTRTEAGD